MPNWAKFPYRNLWRQVTISALPIWEVSDTVAVSAKDSCHIASVTNEHIWRRGLGETETWNPLDTEAAGRSETLGGNGLGQRGAEISVSMGARRMSFSSVPRVAARA